MGKSLAKLGIYSVDIIKYVHKCDIPTERSSETVGQDSTNHFYHLEGEIFCKFIMST